MIKLIAFLKRKPEYTMEAFTQRWLEHTKMSGKMPGLLGYRVNTAVPQQPGGVEPLYDGTAELWWENLAAMQLAFDSDIGKAAGADADTFCSTRIHLYTEEHMIVPDKMSR